MLSCEEVFHQTVINVNDGIMERVKWLVDSRSHIKTDNGHVTFRFFNGIEINQFPEGNVRYVLLSTYVYIHPLTILIYNLVSIPTSTIAISRCIHVDRQC